MLRIIAAIVVSSILILIAWLLAGLPGHVAAQVGKYDFEASAPVVALTLLALFVVGYFLMRALIGFITLPRTVDRVRAHTRRKGGDEAVTRTLLALAAGDHGDARREATRARKLLGDTPQTLLLAAQAGRLAGRENEADAAFRALAAHDQGKFLGLQGLMRQAVAREDWTEAANLARQAEASYPGASWLRAERAQLAVRTGAWHEALALADADAPKAALAAAAAAAAKDPAEGMRFAQQAWKEDPGLVPGAIAYATRLRESGKEVKAQEAIRKSWAANPHPDLADFDLAPITDRGTRLTEARRLAQENPDHPESHFLLARTALEAGNLSEARKEAVAARMAGMNQRRLWLLIAQIEEDEYGDTEEGQIAQRDALRNAASANPDPVWRCKSCGTTLKEWRPACPNCSATGRVSWTAGVEPQRLAG